MNLIIRSAAVLAAIMTGACSSNFSTGFDAPTGHYRVYVMNDAQALAVARGAISQSFPDSDIEQYEAPALGFSARTRSKLDVSTQEVIIHPVSGVTSAGTMVEGYTFEVSARGTLGSGDINTAAFFARLQEDLDSQGNAVDVAQIRPRS